jgi:hypothetical protein
MYGELRVASESLVAFALFGAMLALGLALGGFAVHDFSKARASQTWPAVEGVVLSSPGNNGGLRYAYSVDGQSYAATREAFVSAISFGARPRAPGETVQVYVDPNRPDVSVLSPGGSGLFFFGVAAIAGLLAFFGLGGAIRILSSAVQVETESEAA